MAYICEQVVDNVCVNWIPNSTILDQLAITPEQAVILLTPIFSTYCLLIAWSFLLKFLKQ
jgi:hypothetical protein